MNDCEKATKIIEHLDAVADLILGDTPVAQGGWVVYLMERLNTMDTLYVEMLEGVDDAIENKLTEGVW